MSDEFLGARTCALHALESRSTVLVLGRLIGIDLGRGQPKSIQNLYPVTPRSMLDRTLMTPVNRP